MNELIQFFEAIATMFDNDAKKTPGKARVVLDVDRIDYSRLKRFLSKAMPKKEFLLGAAFLARNVAECFGGSEKVNNMIIQLANDRNRDILNALNGVASDFGIRCSDINFRQEGNIIRVTLDIRGFSSVVNALNKKSSDTGVHFSNVTFKRME